MAAKVVLDGVLFLWLLFPTPAPLLEPPPLPLLLLELFRGRLPLRELPDSPCGRERRERLPPGVVDGGRLEALSLLVMAGLVAGLDVALAEDDDNAKDEEGEEEGAVVELPPPPPPPPSSGTLVEVYRRRRPRFIMLNVGAALSMRAASVSSASLWAAVLLLLLPWVPVLSITKPRPDMLAAPPSLPPLWPWR